MLFPAHYSPGRMDETPAHVLAGQGQGGWCCGCYRNSSKSTAFAPEGGSLTPMTAPMTSARRAPQGGRPSKGKRYPFMSRVPQDLAEVVMEEAEKRGLSYSDYIALVLAERHDVKLPDHFHPPATPDQTIQETLPMQTAS